MVFPRGKVKGPGESKTDLAVEKSTNGDELEKACTWTAAVQASNVAAFGSCILVVVMPIVVVMVPSSYSGSALGGVAVHGRLQAPRLMMHQVGANGRGY
jgi:hypothetical protein